MQSCSLCNTPSFRADATVAYILNKSQHKKNLYKTYHIPNTLQNNSKDIESYKKNTDFTPGFRLKYSEAEAIKNNGHKYAWRHFLKSDVNHAIIFEDASTADDTQLSIYLENITPPKDWDIIAFSPTQYILNKRAAKILYYASLQFNVPIDKYIHAFEVLKVIQVKKP